MPAWWGRAIPEREWDLHTIGKTCCQVRIQRPDLLEEDVIILYEVPAHPPGNRRGFYESLWRTHGHYVPGYPRVEGRWPFYTVSYTKKPSRFKRTT